MQRREFITLVGSAAAWPLTAHAQQPIPTVGFVHTGEAKPNASFVAAFGRKRRPVRNGLMRVREKPSTQAILPPSMKSNSTVRIPPPEQEGQV